jgi:hypothetical protein
MLIKGGGEDGSDQPEIPHPASSLAGVTRRIQIVRGYISQSSELFPAGAS